MFSHAVPVHIYVVYIIFYNHASTHARTPKFGKVYNYIYVFAFRKAKVYIIYHGDFAFRIDY